MMYPNFSRVPPWCDWDTKSFLLPSYCFTMKMNGPQVGSTLLGAATSPFGNIVFQSTSVGALLCVQGIASLSDMRSVIVFVAFRFSALPRVTLSQSTPGWCSMNWKGEVLTLSGLTDRSVLRGVLKRHQTIGNRQQTTVSPPCSKRTTDFGQKRRQRTTDNRQTTRNRKHATDNSQVAALWDRRSSSTRFSILRRDL